MAQSAESCSTAVLSRILRHLDLGDSRNKSNIINFLRVVGLQRGQDFLFDEDSDICVSGPWTGPMLAGLCRAMPNMKSLVLANEAPARVLPSHLLNVLSCSDLRILNLSKTDGATVLWPSPQVISLPLFLVHLGLPPVLLPKGFRAQLDGLTYLTRLECAGTGYLPSPTLVKLRSLTFNGEQVEATRDLRFTPKQRGKRNDYLTTGFQAVSDHRYHGHIRQLAAHSQLTHLSLQKAKTRKPIMVLPCPPVSILHLELSGPFDPKEIVIDLVASLPSLQTLELSSGTPRVNLASTSVRQLALVDVNIDLLCIMGLPNLQELVLAGRNYASFQAMHVMACSPGHWRQAEGPNGQRVFIRLD